MLKPSPSRMSAVPRLPWWQRLTAVVNIALLLLPPNLSAGDILRGGAAANAPRPNPSANSGAAAAAQARSNAQDALRRTSQALQSAQNLQAAARAAALRSGATNLGADPNHPGAMLPNVPDGLAPGGLQFVSAVGANAPTQSGTNVNIKQNSQQALINWTTFNVGRNTKLNFDQSAGGSSAGEWIAFNKVNDPSGSPSQILGSISAQGQVYVINQNGIIFGGGSQVNVHTLVASSLPINDNLVSRGILNNPDAQFLFSALALPAGSKGPTDAFTPPAAPNTATGHLGDVVVQPGAQLTSPTSADHVGGRIALIGPNVRNGGTISTPDGQTILAAGLQVGFDAHKSSDATLRGLDVYVGQVGDYAGTATNAGVIDAPRANVTITGKNVNQLGAINSSTSVSLNGRIDLNASYNAISNFAYNPVTNGDRPPFIYQSAGAVTLGAGSVAQILPEWSSTEKVVGTQLALASQVNMQGKTIHFESNSSLLAPNAAVNVSAGDWQYIASADDPRSTLVHSVGQIYLDSGAMVNVAGSTDVAVPLSQNLLTVTLRGAELANSPLQRGGILRGPSITVDLRKTGVYNGFYWVGTPLADLSGYLGLIERTVGELTVGGGSVNFSAGSSVVVQKGASVDVSGGFVNYGGGTVKTTRVWYSGHIIDIADATPDKLYEGIYTGTFTSSHPRWGITNTYLNALALTGEHYEPPYINGAGAGVLDITAPAMALDGSLLGSTVIGPRQRTDLPAYGELALSFKAQQIVPGDLIYPEYSPTPPAVVFGNGHQAAAAPFSVDAVGDPAPLRDDRLAKVVLSPDLLGPGGFGRLSVDNPDGTVTVPRGVTLNAPAGGSVKLYGSNVNIEGYVYAPGGTINLTAYTISPSDAYLIKYNQLLLPTADPTRGNVTLASGSELNAAGLIVDDRLSASAPLSKPLITNGGSIVISAFSADLAPRSVIDVSGGVAVNAFGKRTYGDGGSISISTGQDQNLLGVIGGHLKLGSDLRGFSGGKGGSLSLQALMIQIGGHTGNPDVLWLKPDFFSEGGFANFNLTGIGAPGDSPDEFRPGIMITPGTVIKPVVKSALAVLYGAGSDDAVMVPVTKPEGLRTPATLTFNATGAVNDISSRIIARGDIVIGAGSLIETDAGGGVTLSGQTVAVFGSIISPGGTIVISGGGKFGSNDDTKSLVARTTVYIGPRSLISAAGKAVVMTDGYGRRFGTIYPGGSITVSGNIVAEAGATLDVSGTSGILDFGPQYLGDAQNPKIPLNSGINSPLYNLIGIPTRIDSNGGSITLKGGQELFVDAKLLGNAGGPTALGGTLAVSSGSYLPGVAPTSADINLVVTQTGYTLPQPFWTSTESPIGRAVLDGGGTPVPAMGYFAASSFLRGGFDSLQLGGNVKFAGPVNIKARSVLSVATGGVIEADSAVTLAAPYVLLGQPFIAPLQPQQQQPVFTRDDPVSGRQPYYPTPTFGTGSLTVIADLIDVGNLLLENIGNASLTARHGDIRGNGTLDIAGNLTLTAAQIYPTTASSFTIAAYDYVAGGSGYQGSITIQGWGVNQLPMSAGGTLSLYSSNIYQGGTLRAPIGTINLGWDGSGTAPVDPLSHLSAPITNKLTLASGSVTSVSAIDPITGQGVLLPYGVILNGKSWIDPTGLDITAGGAPTKNINISAANIDAQSGSTIDLRGGGDLYAYRWVSGIGGTIDILGTPSTDWSSSVTYSAGTLVYYKGQIYSARQSSTGVTPTPNLYWTQVPKSYAVLPGYAASYAPYNPFNTNADATNLGGDPGYVSGGLSVGDRVYLGGSAALRAGVYTLLPARYALLPGGILVTPQSGNPIGTFGLPDGSHLVSGFRFNSLNTKRDIPAIFSRFEVASSDVFRQRAEYEDEYANEFLKAGAEKLGITPSRLPEDAGHLILSASQSMNLLGQVQAQAAPGGRGGLVDISSAADIYIGAGAPGPLGTLTLNASQLSTFGAESLLIGGIRTEGSVGTTIQVKTSNLTLDNAGSPLSSPEIILVSNKNLTLAPGASITQTGSVSGGAETLLIGDANTPGSGDGTLVRVTSDPTAQIVRSGVSSSTDPHMVVGAGAVLAGAGITLDSTYGTSLDPTAALTGNAIYLNSGQISIQLDNPGSLYTPTDGLILAGQALQGLQGASSLSFLSYSSLDTYGTGQIGSAALANLSLHAAEIRGFNTSGGTVVMAAQDILIDNSPDRPAPGAAAGVLSGTLRLEANTIHLGAHDVRIDQFSTVNMTASGGVINEGTGSISIQSAAVIDAPLITASKAAVHTFTAGDTLTLQNTTGGSASVAPGLGANLTFNAGTIVAGSNISLPSGSLTLHATSGDLTVADTLDVGGTARTFFDVTRYTDAGTLSLVADAGNVILSAGSVLNVAAQSGGGDAGQLSVSAPVGSFTSDGTILGSGGAGGVNGTFVLDVGSLSAPEFATLNTTLTAALLNESQSIRVRTGNLTINNTIVAHNYELSLDGGSITVGGAGRIDASGTVGGKITLMASGSITLQSGSVLTVAAQDFSDAGKGGAVSLEAGSEVNGIYSSTTLGSGPQLDLQTGSTIDLSVASVDGAADPVAARALAAFYGNFTGTLHLRAPQTSASTDLQLKPINGSILNASSILVEGYKLFTPVGGSIDSVKTAVQTNGNTFVGTSGTNAAGYATMQNRLFANNTSLIPISVIAPGAEIINTSGNLTLGTISSTSTADWNLATYRFGVNKAPGVLTLRAAGNVTLYNALSDGFTPTAPSSTQSWLWLAPISTQNTALPTNLQSWSYRITAGADLSSADFHSVQALSNLATDVGSLKLGKNAGAASATSSGATATTASIITPTGKSYFQVIRTGTGDIDITTGRSVQLLNQFATIYTAGVQVTNPGFVFTAGDWVSPIITKTPNPLQGSLGSVQQTYFVQYTMAGGNVAVHAQEDIAHLTEDASGNLVADSERQMPTNWLYRRGYVDGTGQFGSAGVTGTSVVNDTAASTTWWIDFSNFFEGIGALGGGNVTLDAGRDVANVDGLVPTNARMPKGTPDASKLVELGGGDLIVRAGRDINGGVYYVERGEGTLQAGRNITTNSTRSPSLNTLFSNITPEIYTEETWLPTTLFLGKGGFDVSAQGDLLLGPTANSFLMPQGLNNRYWYKTYFSTYSPDSLLNVSSLGGNVTFREEATLPLEIGPKPLLQIWQQQEQVLIAGTSASNYQPWLRLIESDHTPFATVDSLLPPTVNVSAFSGDVNLVGDLTLFPSATGNLSILSAGAINGFQPTGPTTGLVFGQTVEAWTASRINVSDANPANVPSITSPFAFVGVVGRAPSAQNSTSATLLANIDAMFAETGSTIGSAAVIQTKQALHAPGLLHAGDANPVQLYANGGDISGLTLFSPKAARVVAKNDIADVALYLQNVSSDDISLVAAGRDVIAYDANTAARVLSRSTGNFPAFGQTEQAGDLQISGPGAIEVFAGRNLDLGSGSNNADGTGVGLTSIGNGRNPYLPFAGADIIAGAGIDAVSSLQNGALDISNFVAQFVNGPNGARYLSELNASLAASGTTSGFTNVDASSFTTLPKDEQERLALALFFIVLRDAGRDHNLAGSPGFGTYAEGFNAIAALFPNTTTGDITTQGRDVRTKNGGSISLLAPGGGLTLQTAAVSGALAPPGIITESGGAISIFTNGSVDLGISRIFTLRGGDITIWSSTGNIAAGSSSKTVQSAPPTRVLIDPQSGNVKTDLAGLATGGGIGVLATVSGIAPGNVDLIAPVGTIDAGDAGIRATGNLNIAATAVLNASNIAVGGASAGTPTVVAPSAPNIAGIAGASNTAGAGSTAASDANKQAAAGQTATSKEEVPSIITVEVVGYGGGESESAMPASNRNPDEDEEERRKRMKKEAEQSHPQPTENKKP